MNEAAADLCDEQPEPKDEVAAALEALDPPGQEALQADWPRAPTEEEWAAMSEAERAQVVARLETWLSSGALDFMAEGPTHFENKTRSWDRLKRYFSRGGRQIYVAADMAVFYPGHKAIVPDVVAILDRGPPAGESWMVAIEGKGPDWALEIHVSGDRRKDITGNVEKYAALGISEYFVFDWNSKQLFGHQLPGPGARRYQRIRPRLGRYPSAVLGLDLTVVDGELGFFHGTAQLLGADELIGQLQRLVDEQGEKAQEETEALRQQLQQAEEGRHRAEDELQRAQGGLREAVITLLSARPGGLSAADRERVLACADAARLLRWISRAVSMPAAAAAEVLDG
jgi:Uma2 family endonuclease